MKVSINYDPAFAGMRVWLYEDKPDGSTWVVNPIDLTITSRIDPAEVVPPTFRFDRHNGTEFLQSFANALVEAGFKPDEIKAHDKEVVAIKTHLEDMRTLVFKGKK